MLSAARSHSSMRPPLASTPILGLRPFILLPLLAALLPSIGGVTEQPVVKTPEGTALMAAQQQRNMLETSLKPFFYINNKFLDIIQPFPPNAMVILDLVNKTTNITGVRVPVETYFQIAWPVIVAYPGYFSLLCLGIVLLIVVPIVGACWCSCRCCCNRCGANAKPMDGRFARCRRGTFGVVLGVLSTLVLGGAVLSFISNDLLHRPFQMNSHDNPVTVLNSSVAEVADSLDTILKNFNNQTLVMLGRQVPLVKSSVRNASDLATNQIVKESNILRIISNGKGLTASIQPYMDAAEDISNQKASFLEAYTNLTTEMKNITDNLRHLFASCIEASCNNSIAMLDSLTYVPADKVDLNISDRVIASLSQINTTQVAQLLNNTKTLLLNISNQMSEMGAAKVDALLANLNDSKKIDSYFKRLRGPIGNITRQMRTFAGVLNNGTVMNKKWAKFLVEVDEYRMYGFIGLASTILLIVFFFYLGLCFGACGEPPYEDARLCNRGAGATLMSCGIGFTFLFFPFVVLVVIATFLVGAPVRTEMCRYLVKGQPNMTDFDTALSQTLNNFNISIFPGEPFPPNFTYHLLGDCENNTSIVTALSLQQLISGSIIYEKEVQPSVVALRQKMKELNLRIDINTITSQTQATIDKMVTEKLNFEGTFIAIENQLAPPAIKNFDTLTTTLTSAGEASNSSANVSEAIARMIELQKPLESDMSLFRTSLQKMRNMRLLQTAIGAFRAEILDFSKNMQPGSALLIKQIDLSFTALDQTVRDILVKAVDLVLSEYASCRTMNQQAVRVVDLVCRNILDPFNGYWLGIGWSLLILIPSLILACKLNYLYRKTEYYVKDYEETDYMTYQGFYPSDVIPLERKARGKSKQTKGHARGALRGSSGGILRHTGPPDPLPCSAGSGPGMPDRRGWQHPYTKLPVYPRDAYD